MFVFGAKGEGSPACPRFAGHRRGRSLNPLRGAALELPWSRQLSVILICFNKLVFMAKIQIVTQPFLVMVAFILGYSSISQELVELPHWISIYLSRRY